MARDPTRAGGAEDAGMSGPGAFAVIGPGRAGCTIAAGLIDAGWNLVGIAGGNPESASTRAAAERWDVPVGTAAEVVVGASLVVIATPDRIIAEVAASIAEEVEASALVIHLSGAVPLAALEKVVARIGALHPLQTMSAFGVAPEILRGVWCATAGDPEVEVIATTLGMKPFNLLDTDRARYHAAASIAANHLVALTAQIEATTDVPFEAFVPLMRTALDNVAMAGPSAALTGPVARGDVDTVRIHLSAIPSSERAAYVVLARRAAVLAGRDPDADFDGLLS